MAMEPHQHGPLGPPKRPSRSGPVTSGPQERVSNRERDAVVEQLRLNTADGRLDIEEFGERVEHALAARTGAELSQVLHDLPHVVPPTQAAAKRRTAVRSILVPYLAVNVFLVLVWLVTGAGYFWPIWVILGWGLGVVLSLAAVAGRR